MTGEDVRFDRVTKRDYLAVVYEDDGHQYVVRFPNKSLDEVFEAMHAHKIDGHDLWYEVKLATFVPASSNR